MPNLSLHVFSANTVFVNKVTRETDVINVYIKIPSKLN